MHAPEMGGYVLMGDVMAFLSENFSEFTLMMDENCAAGDIDETNGVLLCPAVFYPIKLLCMPSVDDDTTDDDDTTEATYSCGSTIQECEAAYLAASTPVVSTPMMTYADVECAVVDSWTFGT